MPRLHAAIIGTGFMGRVHLEAILRLGFVGVKTICGRRDDAARNLAEAFGVPNAVTEYSEVLADPEIDAVHLCTPNRLHGPQAIAALEAGKHVLSEKPLATSASDAARMVALARQKGLRNCTCHNLRYYPMVQQMRRMCEAGDLGEVLVAQGTYSQDWLLYDTDWNWRADPEENGPSRALADIGSHWCDMAEHVTGLRISSLVADLKTYHPTRKRPKSQVETFASKSLAPDEFTEFPIESEDFASVMFQMGPRARGSFTVSQVSAGRKNHLAMEIYGSQAGAAWDQERPNQLWIGRRDRPNEVLIKDPSLMHEDVRHYAAMPGGHAEGYPDTFRQVFAGFYGSILAPGGPAHYPQFEDGLRQLRILEAALTSNEKRTWVDVGEPV